MAESLIKIVLVDDHTLFRKGLISLIEVAVPRQTNVLFEAANGAELCERIQQDNLPDIVIMDINMPRMNGFESVLWLQEHYPSVRILVVSMIEKEESIVQMLKMGVKGYLCKDVEPKELGEAILAIMQKGYYYTDFITGKLIHSLGREDRQSEHSVLAQLSDREMQFLKLACSELTYNEIAAQMFLSPKTIDGYRSSLFEKLEVKSRVGLVLFAIRSNILVP